MAKPAEKDESEELRTPSPVRNPNDEEEEEEDLQFLEVRELMEDEMAKKVPSSKKKKKCSKKAYARA